MKITLNLPEIDTDSITGIDYETGAPDPAPDCTMCGQELTGTAVKLLPYGWLHAEGCLQKLVDSLGRIGPQAAWLVVAQHVAKYPSKHPASTIRAVLTELMKPTWKLRNEMDR